MRGERIEKGGVTILNDCYNANPEAVRAMLDVLGATPAQRRLAVLGEMLELGRSAEPLHREIGNYVAGRGIDVLIGIRGASRHMVDEAVRAGMSGAAYFFDDPETAGDFLRSLARAGDAILFKGSRGVAVEKAMERLLADREV
jgi:UDP-N-acetylmuramoyl-tripeptide--D-alanyl-D-alanine ligase